MLEVRIGITLGGEVLEDRVEIVTRGNMRALLRYWQYVMLLF